jgi:dTDP-4-dehydrorhamnose reductase
VRAAHPRHVILRTSWLFAAHGQNFVRTMLRLCTERDTIGVVADQHGCPTPAADLANVSAHIARALVCDRIAPATYHYAGRGAATWFAFAQAIFARASRLLTRMPQLKAISTAEFGATAVRPAFSVLDCGKLERECGLVAGPWQRGLDAVIAELEASHTPAAAAR